jgi:hypothetical protein
VVAPSEALLSTSAKDRLALTTSITSSGDRSIDLWDRAVRYVCTVTVPCSFAGLYTVASRHSA